MVDNNQVYEAAPSDIEDDEQSRKGRGYGSKAALTVASGIAMASGMFMGNQMLVPAIVGASADTGANVQTLGNNGDSASAAELGTGSSASGVSFGSANEDNSVFAMAAGKAFGKTAFGASAEELAAFHRTLLEGVLRPFAQGAGTPDTLSASMLWAAAQDLQPFAMLMVRRITSCSAGAKRRGAASPISPGAC